VTREADPATGWSIAAIPDLAGQVVVVTGANSGIGLETAAALAGAGATVVMACRNLEKANEARRQLEAMKPPGRVEVLRLDLADQRQIAEAAAEAEQRLGGINVLINNAGVMSLPLSYTVDGFETVFGTNHLGHFAFTCRLLPTLIATPGSRVVTVSSLSHRIGQIRWDDLAARRGRYWKSRAYAQSKLANLLFAFELERRLSAAGTDTSSLAAHPGFAATEIIGHLLDRFPRVKRGILRAGDRVISATAAARPTLRAATSAEARGGQFYGPGGRLEIFGSPTVVTPASRSRNAADQIRLWELSAELTGVDFTPGRSPSDESRTVSG
jgi:NAD(P)-dependent dehydrogenase (short-subunit alcohol dehydrogenase family)